uniref:Putative secreted protein n=1 Tax=Anopheles marajoara TaxID=58244 RepID=A0A2M4C6H3_9DIPT
MSVAASLLHLVFCFASGGIGSVNHMPSRGSLYYPSPHGLPVCLAHTGEPMRDKCMFVCLLVSNNMSLNPSNRKEGFTLGCHGEKSNLKFNSLLLRQNSVKGYNRAALRGHSFFPSAKLMLPPLIHKDKAQDSLFPNAALSPTPFS